MLLRISSVRDQSPVLPQMATLHEEVDSFKRFRVIRIFRRAPSCLLRFALSLLRVFAIAKLPDDS